MTTKTPISQDLGAIAEHKFMLGIWFQILTVEDACNNDWQNAKKILIARVIAESRRKNMKRASSNITIDDPNRLIG